MINEDKASNPHPAYAGLEAKREVYRAVYGGTDAIRKGAEKFLPKYPAEEKSEYDVRLSQATIDGIVTGGVEQLCGSVFEGEIDVSGVHSTIKPLLENVDNKGNSFNIFARDAFRESFEGHSLILVDMPTEKAADAEEEKNKGLRPYLNLYCAGNVINWRFRVNPISKQKELVLLVLKEVSAEPKGKFGTENVTRYRVFMFDGTVKWELWKEVKGVNNEKELVLEDDGVIEGVTAIPAAFVGDVMDDPKLLVESRLEIKAYQKESSFDSIEYLSVPTFYTKGYDGEDALKLGASAHLKLPENGDVGFAQIDSAGLEKLGKTIADIKSYIKARVQYMADQAMQQPEKSATEVVVADKDKQARLIVWADQLKDALERSLQFMGQFLRLGEDDAGEIVLRTKWTVAEEKRIESEERRAKGEEANIKATLAKVAPAKV